MEEIIEDVSKHAQVVDIVMLPYKSYCFLRFNDKHDAKQVHDSMNGISKLGQNGAVLLMSYCEAVPDSLNDQPWRSSLPDGLILIENCITPEDEAELLRNLKWDESDDDAKLKNRKVQHFGYEFLYGSNRVDPSCPLKDRQIPDACDRIWDGLKSKCPRFADFRPDQLTVNRYEPGNGIPAHCDTHSCFEDPIVSLSLGSSVDMQFKRPDTSQHVSVRLPRRSLLVMSGESRHGWTHGITPRMSDVVATPDGHLTVQKRELRTSFTFRKLKGPPGCSCSFPALCDVAAGAASVPDTDLDVSDQLAAKLEIEKVHKVYNEIGSHFSETRHSPWPNVEHFVRSLGDDAILIDVGCGNGKYLAIDNRVVKLGCDRSDALLKVCTERKFNVFQCDCLALPLRDDSIDACISIAVIHHLATTDRRSKAIREMIRVLVKGGTALIYVWAKDQQKDNKKSSYLLQHQKKDAKEPTETSTFTIDTSEIQLPVHRSRTQFHHTNILVPWKLKEKEVPQDQQKIFLRYYHVFEDGELENLCRECPGVEVVSSYYDQGNHCVIIKKI